MRETAPQTDGKNMENKECKQDQFDIKHGWEGGDIPSIWETLLAQ